MRSIRSLALLALLGSALSIGALAQIKSFTLSEIVQTADQAVHGQIIASNVVRVDSPDDGEHYFTRLTILGRRLYDGQTTTVEVAFRGGFVSPTEGVFNSEAPAADDVQVGRRVVAFYRWADDMGGGFAANALVAAHGGIYRTVDGPLGAAVLGRGEGYAISANRRVTDLESAVRVFAANK
jgi:hypothetical protein